MSSNPNLTGVNGGDALTQAVEMNAQYDRGDLAWILVAGVLVWIMIPGVGLLYSGLARRHHSLSLIWQALMAVSVTTFQWFFWGYSLTFSHTGGPFIGDLANFGTKGVLAAPSVGSLLIPDILFYLYQLMFAATTAMIMVGGAMERGRLIPSAIFIFIWETVVYDPIAFWTWNGNGWLFKLGSLDFAGGGPVHMSSGAGALAYALVLGKRLGPEEGQKFVKAKPSNIFFVALGTIFLWFGWFGFNGGSALNMTLRAIYAAANTNLAASCGAITFCIMDGIRHKKGWSMVGLCCGAVAGLVGITPACGYVPIYTAVPIGVVTAVACNFAFDVKDLLGIDDGLDVFALHGIGGFVGNIMTGIFACDYVPALDGYSVLPGGWIMHNWKQVGYQLAGCTAILSYSFTVTFILLFVANKIPGCSLRVPDEIEERGLDELEIGEVIMEYGIMQVLEAGVDKLAEEKASRKSLQAENPGSSSSDEAQEKKD